MAWWAPGSQSASRTGRGQVRARPTARVVTPGEPPAEVRMRIAMCSSALSWLATRVADKGDPVLGRQLGDGGGLVRGDVDVDQDGGPVGSVRLVDHPRGEGIPSQLVGPVLGRKGDQAYG